MNTSANAQPAPYGVASAAMSPVALKVPSATNAIDCRLERESRHTTAPTTAKPNAFAQNADSSTVDLRAGEGPMTSSNSPAGLRQRTASPPERATDAAGLGGRPFTPKISSPGRTPAS